MFNLFPGKTPMRMRLEAERRANPQPKRQPSGDVDPSKRPTLHSESGDKIDATIDWLAHLAAGRIPVR
jgi:hypothetical protein